MKTLELSNIHPTTEISSSAAIGRNVTIGPFAVIHDDVQIGDNVIIGSHCVLGEPTFDYYRAGASETGPCRIGDGSVIRSHSIMYRGVTIGSGFECGHRVTIREGSMIGKGVRIGTLSDLQGDLTIGDYSRLHSSVFVPGGTTIEEFCWLFPGVTLTNDPHPPSDPCTEGPTIRRFAAVAARAVIFPGVEIGEQALVGAMSLVTRDVPAKSVAVGTPARVTGSVFDIECRHGALDHVYPWSDHFRRGYPDGVLPAPGALD